MPTENFFYSHTYGFLYGMPTTLTGGMATYKLQDKLLVNAGLDTGWNNVQSPNGKINAMFGVNWTSGQDGKVNVTSEWFIGNMSARAASTAPAPRASRTLPSSLGREMALYFGKHRVP